MTSPSRQQGIILFAHGSRDALWRLPIEAVAQRIQTVSPQTDVACAYLELTAPDLPTTAAMMIARGIQHIVIVPMFLGVGRHAREDLPVLVQQLQKDHADVQFDLRRAIGEEPQLTQAMANIALASLP
ncbi:sirohydrochlorin chelatase [Limnohabitans sp. Hippo4]|uniref:sirohydrochlorin chelatase n=1 Tax=Limnohabitans sp. Hippo4 TaxID=1826167 RepID=UPI000D3CCA3B|nr:CbiX/SirB N-terminal domain-containing protein [Limnohabitans sp. Hippo4]PUE37311.1 cobalamin biosynthesis protein CbiX [Limnohabitans sp. Hippo4]